jgi:hypothetical protein
MTKLIVAFRDFANALKNRMLLYFRTKHDVLKRQSIKDMSKSFLSPVKLCMGGVTTNCCFISDECTAPQTKRFD